MRQTLSVRVRVGVCVAIMATALVIPAVACAITRDDVLARCQSWVNAGVPYNQGATYDGYRTDCSGFVSYAWNTGTSYVTWTLPQVGSFITKDQLLPGDALLDNLSPTADQHVLIFKGWANSAHTSYYAYEMTPPVVYSPTISPYPYWSTWPYSGNYRPFRYNGIQDNPSSANVVSPDDSGFTKTPAGGTAQGWYPVSNGGNCGQAIFTYVNNTGRQNWAHWDFNLAAINGAGVYQVDAFIPDRNAGTTNAVYHVNSANGLQYHSVNQGATSGWQSLGTYALNPGSAWVELDDDTGEAYAVDVNHEIAFDSIRLTYVGPAPTLGCVGAVTMSPGPYHNGDTVTGSFTVSNTGVQAGTWAPLVLAFRGPNNENRDAVVASTITLAPGQSQTVQFSRKLDIVGTWTGFVSGCLSSTTWQSPAGATVAAFPVAPALVPIPTSIKLSGNSSVKAKRAYRLSGSVTPSGASGSVAIAVARLVGKKWRGAGSFTRTVSGGHFSYTFKPRSKGKWRVTAAYSGQATSVAIYNASRPMSIVIRVK